MATVPLIGRRSNFSFLKYIGIYIYITSILNAVPKYTLLTHSQEKWWYVLIILMKVSINYLYAVRKKWGVKKLTCMIKKPLFFNTIFPKNHRPIRCDSKYPHDISIQYTRIISIKIPKTYLRIVTLEISSRLIFIKYMRIIKYIC